MSPTASASSSGSDAPSPARSAATPPDPAANGRAPGTDGRAILLFDGVCNLCNGFVNALIDRDPDAKIRLAALQSDAARPYLQAFGLDPAYLDSVVLIEEGRVYRKSTAALRVARHLDGPWPLAYYAFIGVPRALRDAVYDVIARFRYDWFGQRDTCRMPTPDVQRHFL